MEVISELIEKGLDVARLNFSHGEYEQFKRITNNVRQAYLDHARPPRTQDPHWKIS